MGSTNKESYKVSPDNMPDSESFDPQTIVNRHLQGDLEYAKKGYQALINEKRHDANVCSNLAAIYMSEHNLEKAEELLREAVKLDPEHNLANFNLGNVLMVVDRLEESTQYFKNVLDKDSSLGGALCKYWHLRMKMCDWSEYPMMLASLSKAIQIADVQTNIINIISPFSLLGVHDDLVMHLKTSALYANGTTSQAQLLPALSSDHKRTNSDIIKVAFLSADFYDHATAFLIAELFELFDTKQFEIHAISYGNNGQNSVMRKRIESGSGYFHDVASKTDEEIAKLIADSSIDIAVDLKGFTAESRPAILACRPAPVQVNYLGYPGSMGADFIDYIIADPFVIPEDAQSGYTEKIMYMPDSYQVNDRHRLIDSETPSREACGLPADGFVFCSFNHNYKITPDVFDVWMELLEETPGSVLWLLESNQWANKNLKKEAESRDVNPARLIFAEQLPMDQHLARIQNADLFLDTFPCNAHTTASDALWMSLPLLTLSGRSFAARVAGSLLKAIDLEELITTDLTEYKSLALELAHDPEKLSNIKLKLKNNRDTCSLFDTECFKNNLQKGFIHMVELSEAGTETETFYVSDLEDTHPLPVNDRVLFNIAIIRPDNHVHSDTFNQTVETLSHSLIELGFITNIAENTMIDNGINIILGADFLEEDDLEHLPDSGIIYNLAPVTEAPEWMTPALLDIFNKFDVWDSSETSIDTLNNMGIAKKIHYVPVENTEINNVVDYINEALMSLGNEVTILGNIPTPLISILTPSYNRANYIETAITSALKQDYPNFEIIIVDDGSSDNTAEIVKSLEDPRIKFISKEHSGAPKTRNRCIEEASGEYVLMLDSDDELMPGVLTQYAKILDQYAGTDIVYGDLQSFDEQGDKKIFCYEDLYKEKNLLSKMLRGSIIPNGGSLIRKELFNMFGGYDEDFPRADDYEFWTRVITFANIKHSGIVSYRWRWHDSNMTSGLDKVDTSFEAGILKRSCTRFSMQELFPQLNWEDAKKASTTAWTTVGSYLQSWNDFDNAMIAYKQASLTAHDEGSQIALAAAVKELVTNVVDQTDSESGEYISDLVIPDKTLEPEPLVSVILPNMNQIVQLVPALRSLVDQTYTNWEAIVICDPEENDLNLLDSIDSLNRIQLINPSENQSLASDLNTAIRSSKGSVICYLNEGLYQSDHISTVVDTMRKNEAEFVYCKAIPNENNDQDNKQSSLNTLNHIPLSTWGHRRDLLHKSGLFDTTLAALEDWEMLLRFSRVTDFISVQKLTVGINENTFHENLYSSQLARQLYDRYTVRNNEIQNERIAMLVSPLPQPVLSENNYAATPFISILTPTYNRSKYIKSAISSALDQNYSNFEIIIVDDGSSDNTADIVRNFDDPRIRFVTKKHSGAPATRNRCIEEAQGEYVLWLDSDDELIPGVLTHYASILKQYSGVDIVYGDLQSFDEQGDNKIYPREDHYRDQHLLSKMLQGNVIPNGGTLVRKELYNMFGGYDEDFRRAHDYEFWTRVVKFAVIKHSGIISYRWRWHDSNISTGVETTDTSFEAGIVKKICHRHSMAELFPGLDWTDPNKSSAIAWRIVGLYLQNYLDFDNAITAYEQALKTASDDPVFAEMIANSVVDANPANGEYTLKLETGSRSLEPNPLVTVIVFCKNHPETIKSSLLSIINQTYENWEAIVIYDTNKNDLDLEESVDPLNRIKYFNYPEDENPSSARNAAIRTSNGSVICYLDESEFLPDHIDSVVKALKINNAEFVYSDVVNIEQKDQVEESLDVTISQNLSDVSYSTNRLHVSNFIPISSWGHRRDLLEKSGFFDGSLTILEDWEILLRFSRLTDFTPLQKPTIKAHQADNCSNRSLELFQTYKNLYVKYPVDNPDTINERRTFLESLKRNLDRHNKHL